MFLKKALSIFVLASACFVFSAEAENVYVSPHDCPYLKRIPAKILGKDLRMSVDNKKVTMSKCNMVTNNHFVYTVYRGKSLSSHPSYLECLYTGNITEGSNTLFLHTHCQQIKHPKIKSVLVSPVICPKRTFQALYNRLNTHMIFSMSMKQVASNFCPMHLMATNMFSYEFSVYKLPSQRHSVLAKNMFCKYVGQYVGIPNKTITFIFDCKPPPAPKKKIIKTSK